MGRVDDSVRRDRRLDDAFQATFPAQRSDCAEFIAPSRSPALVPGLRSNPRVGPRSFVPSSRRSSDGTSVRGLIVAFVVVVILWISVDSYALAAKAFRPVSLQTIGGGRIVSNRLGSRMARGLMRETSSLDTSPTATRSRTRRSSERVRGLATSWSADINTSTLIAWSRAPSYANRLGGIAERMAVAKPR